MNNHQEWLRLQQLYAGLSDGELLNLFASKSELTTVAQEAIDAEMSSRGLKDSGSTMAERLGDSLRYGSTIYEGSAATPSVPTLPLPEETTSVDDPALVELTTFAVPMDAEKAMRLLDEHDVPAHMEHAMRQVNEDGPKVKMNWISIFVERERKDDAMRVLRDGMGLFPVMESNDLPADDDADDDDESLSILGNFELAVDAETAKKALTDAGIWFQAELEDGVDGTMIEVRHGDFERGLQVVEEAFGEEE
jgi:hypothetical protein